MGVRPVGQVLGASVHQVGYQYLPAPSLGTTGWVWSESGVYELGTVMRAWDQGRRRALDRLTEEALQLNADAVSGVRLHRGDHDWARGSIDYLVTGTAVRFPSTERLPWPVLSGLSVQDYWQLRSAGYEPVGLVAATAVIFVVTS